MGPAEHLAHSPAAGQGDAERAQEAGIEQPDGEQLARQLALAVGQQRRQGVRGPGRVVHHDGGGVVVQGRGRRDDDERGHQAGEDGAHQGLQLAHPDVVDIEPLVHHGALLEEDHPRRDGSPDVGQQDEEQGPGDPARYVDELSRRVQVQPGRQARDEAVAHDAPAGGRRGLHGPERRRDVDEVEEAEEQREFFERPVLAREHDAEQDQGHPDEGDDGRNAEHGARGDHPDVFGDQGEPVGDGQVGDGEPAPERAETLEDRLGVPAFCHGTQANGHFLHVIRHGDQDDEDPQQPHAVLGAGDRIGGDAAGIVVGDHDNDPGAEDGEEDEQPAPPALELMKGLAQEVHGRTPSG